MYTRLYRSGTFIPPIPIEEPPSDPVAPPHTAGSSASRIIATYGPPRVKERPWARDKRLGTRNAGDESDEDEEDEKASKEELAKDLHVVSVDVKITENCEKHRTSQYSCTKARKNQDGVSLPPELVVRRGQPFRITVKFNQPFLREKHGMQLIFITGKKPETLRFYISTTGTFQIGGS